MEDVALFDKYVKGYWREFPEDYLEIVEKRCRDRGFCRSGMLGPLDKLTAVLEEDELTLRSLGVTRHQIADVLETIQQLATDASQDTEVPILGGRFTVRSWQYCGIQGTPFYHPDDECGWWKCTGSQNLRVTRKDGATFSFGTLLIDLIRYNGFFEGPGVEAVGYREMKTFRLDPKLAVEFFNIKPGVDYAPRYENRVCWSAKSSGEEEPSLQYEQLVRDLALKHHSLSNGDEVFLSWLPMVFDSYATNSDDPIDFNKFVMEKLLSMPSPEAQMDYLLECEAGTVRYPENIAKVRKALKDMRSSPDDTSYLDALAIETFRHTKHDECVETVFGAAYHRYGGYSRDCDCYEISLTRHGREMVGWNDSIGKSNYVYLLTM